MTAIKNALTIPGLETVYDALAAAIDQAGPDKAELFLVKLALLNANALASPQAFQSHVQ
ncbi:MAG: MhaB, partial [Polaromonas sp.]|nr:MhaB [Polaromonas sp.]